MYTGLGFRPAGFKPSKVDYAEYEQLRDQFLRSPRGRAARLAGGILGRLARDVVSDEEVCLGPSTEVLSTGVRLWDGTGPTTYWDDVLTEQEVDLICGVYEVATGKQKTHISWWPRPRAWLTSGIYTGWWSPDCERWYQRRLEAIGSDSAKPSPQTKWKSHIKFFQEARLVAQANETMAAEFLA
ncbi:hypothetical protein C8J57DRAFT_1047354 [Mycena rebaudengoi]|nr:hypothetical protein C8J57DRAFT_1047354 [Mycena rebaudengoi]